MIPALTFDIKQDGWESSRGFVKRLVPLPSLNEKSTPLDAVSVLLEIRFGGVCGTDRGIWHRSVFRDLIRDSLKKEGKTQRILGHEFVGKVIEAGSLVKPLYGISMGDEVSGDSHVTCGRCFQCHIGEQEVCQDQKILGISADGIFAKYVKIPAKNLWVVDFTRIRPEIAAMLDPFGNAVHACSRVDLRGKRVAILGCGPIGMFTILLARTFGAAKVIAADINKENLAMGKRLGAHFTLHLNQKKERPYDIDKDLKEMVHELTYGKGVDAAFEMAGPNASVNNALEITRSGGEVILFGLKDGDFVIPNFNRAIVKGLTLHGVIGRKIFNTWQISQRVLSDKTNGVQDAMWRVILKEGKGTIIPFASYDKELFEKKMREHPKILLKM
ncbi:MAG: zinc-binding dehydrogenase [Candidatus Portnoybacteria bacterium]|nr:zinc-binding dehydrogenase [Candidatus Portnoybacteria bacterium]